MNSQGALEGPGLVLRPEDADRVRRGIPELDLERLPGASGLPAGVAAPLLDGRGHPVGAGVADPERGAFRVWSHRPVEAFDERFFRAKVDDALARRASLLRSGETEAWRLIHGDGDGLSGIAVDAWGEFLTIEALGGGPALWTEAIAGALARRLQPRGIIEKRLSGPSRALERGKAEERVLLGEEPPGELRVIERGVPFLVRLRGARHEGLFTDMRDERRRLSEAVSSMGGSPSVLNAFAYTGSFSVVAARAGARVTSLDIVAKALEWAKENFRLSGIDPGEHHFARMDVGEFLGLALRRGWSYGAIVLDPPTFASARGARWSLRRDYSGLIAKALRVLAPRGLLWVSANAAGVPEREVDRWISAGAKAAGRKLRTVARGGQPIDYPAPQGFPRYGYLKVRVVEGVES